MRRPSDPEVAAWMKKARGDQRLARLGSTQVDLNLR
jgi:hypothetical protein